MGNQLPSPKGGGAPQFSAHVYCDQTSVCVRIPLGTKVGLSLGDIVLDGDPDAPPLKGHGPQIFGQCPLWPNSWMDYDPLGMGVGLGPGHIVLDGDPASLPQRGTASPIFSPYLFWPNGWMD